MRATSTSRSWRWAKCLSCLAPVVSRTRPPRAGKRSAASAQGSGVPEEDRDHRSERDESIQDLWNERWPKIDIDDSLRLLALPPRSLRVR